MNEMYTHLSHDTSSDVVDTQTHLPDTEGTLEKELSDDLDKAVELLSEDSLREMLMHGGLDIKAQKRLEALLEGVQGNNFAAAAQKLGVSRSNLTRWKNILLESGGDPTSLNSKEIQYETEEDIEAIVKAKTVEYLDEHMPEDTYLQTTEHGAVIDLGKMKEQLQEIAEEGKHKRTVQDIKFVSQQRLAVVLFERHQDKEYISKEQVERGNLVPKPLFYQPASAEAAGSSLDIADAEFHLPLWDMGKNTAKGRETLYPTEDGSEISGMEARIALMLFHPDYGDGRRSSRDGKLYLKNPDYDPSDAESQKRVVFGTKVLKKFGGDTLMNSVYRDGSLENKSIRETLEQELPNLTAGGELVPEDIQQITLTWQGNEAAEIAQKEIKNKHVMFGGVRHYVGAKFNGCYAKPLNEETALIFEEVDEGQIIKGRFTLIKKDNASAEVKHKTGEVSFRSANSDLTQPTEINYSKLIPAETDGFRQHTTEQKRESLAREITENIKHIVELADSAEDLVTSEFGEGGVESVTPESVKADLLKQAERLVMLASKAQSEKELRDQLDTFEADVRAFSALSKNAGLENLLKKPLERISAASLSDKDRADMHEQLRMNYSLEYPDDEDRGFREGVETSFERALVSPETEFYILRDQDRIVSFYRYDKKIDANGEEALYFGSFNGNPLYKGASGNLPEVTAKEKLSQTDRMFAHCDPESDISKKYIESGFIGTQLVDAWDKPSFEIWQSSDSARLLQTKQMEIEDLVAMADQTQPEQQDYFVREVESSDPFHELDEGLSFLLTRYFIHEGKTYAAFELNTSLSQKFIFEEKA
jgi:transposase-like protein